MAKEVAKSQFAWGKMWLNKHIKPGERDDD